MSGTLGYIKAIMTKLFEFPRLFMSNFGNFYLILDFIRNYITFMLQGSCDVFLFFKFIKTKLSLPLEVYLFLSSSSKQ